MSSFQRMFWWLNLRFSKHVGKFLFLCRLNPISITSCIWKILILDERVFFSFWRAWIKICDVIWQIDRTKVLYFFIILIPPYEIFHNIFCHSTGMEQLYTISTRKNIQSFQEYHISKTNELSNYYEKQKEFETIWLRWHNTLWKPWGISWQE